MCWSCSWMRRLCLEEWRWGFSQQEHFMLVVPQPVICVHWWLLFLCVLGPSPGDGLLLHVWLAGRCSSSSPYSVSLLSHSHMSVCALMSTHVWLWLSHLQTPWYLTRVWCWWWCFWLLFTISVNILFFFPVLSLKLISAIWWCPQWWASIVLLSSRASCLVRRTPTSHRYLTANLHISYLTVTSNQEWCSTFLFFLMRHSTFHFRSLQTACHCSS